MRCLVTGCAGFIGSHLTESLLQDRHAVVGIDCFNDNYGRSEKLRNLAQARDWEDFDFVPIDLARGQLEDLVADSDAIFHLAAEPGVRPSWGVRFETYVRNNVIATQHLLESAAAWPDRPFVYASSSSVYGDAEQLPTTEDATARPRSPYGVTKLSAEHLCRAYHANWGVAVVALRYFSVFGPRQRPDMAFTRFCRAALENQELVVYGDGRQTRDFTFVRDVVAATRAAAERPEAVGGIYNIGGGARLCLTDALAVLEEITGRPLHASRQRAQPGDVRDTAADTTRAQQDLGYVPQTAFAEGLAEQFEWVLAAYGTPDRPAAA